MGDKDTNKLFGNPELPIGEPGGEMKSLGVITDCTLQMPDYDPREDELKVFQDSITVEIPVPASPFFVGADFASEPSKEVCSLVIMGEPKINKPKNLKYPNKKRARRVWKKWKRRFGTTPGKMMYLPNVEIESEMANEHYGYPYWRVKAKPIKNSNGNN